MTDLSASEVWERVLDDLQIQVTRPTFETWLKQTAGVAVSDDAFVVGAPNAFVAEMLEQRMSSLIAQAVERQVNRRLDVRIEVGNGDRACRAVRQRYGRRNGRRGSAVAIVAAPEPARGRRSRLNPRYTFESFIVGKSNELAHGAARAVADRPGLVYNPLVMYSKVGLGKTHLLHAIGHLAGRQSASLIYTTTEDFTTEYIRAIREGTTEEFRETYRAADVLLLDDIQFLIGKEQTQEGFFHTFNALHMSNRQIVITSDRPVAALTLLEDRIQSRLQGGLVVDIQSPDLETRMAILRAKADEREVELSPQVLALLAGRVRKNIRELEGVLNRVVAYADLTQAEITPELVARAVAEPDVEGKQNRASERDVIDAVSEYYDVEEEEIKGRRRDKATTLARQVTMYMLREDAKLGASAIGHILGGKTHATVLHGCRTIEGAPEPRPQPAPRHHRHTQRDGELGLYTPIPFRRPPGLGAGVAMPARLAAT